MSPVAKFLWGVAFMLALGGLYHTRYQAQAEIKELRHNVAQLAQAREQNRLLQAEWSNLNDPRHLQKMAHIYLDLVPLSAAQLARPYALRPQEAQFVVRE